MFKKMKKNGGFTLVELMIVIAIIGVLALVLIPQASKMRTNAKLSGVDANARIAVANIQGLIDDNTTAAGLATAIQTKLSATELANPIDGEISVPAVAAALPTTGTAPGAIVIDAVTYANKAAADAALASDGATKPTCTFAAGSIVVAVFGTTPDDLGAAVYGFDNKGKSMTPTAKANYTIVK